MRLYQLDEDPTWINLDAIAYVMAIADLEIWINYIGGERTSFFFSAREERESVINRLVEAIDNEGR